MPTQAANVQKDIPILNKITSVLTRKLIKLSKEISSSFIFDFIDQPLTSNLAITGLNLMQEVQICCTPLKIFVKYSLKDVDSMEKIADVIISFML